MDRTNLALISHSCVDVILTAIKRNGLEKTLQDLRQSATYLHEPEEEIYQSFLASVKWFDKIERNIHEDKS